MSRRILGSITLERGEHKKAVDRFRKYRGTPDPEDLMESGVSCKPCSVGFIINFTRCMELAPKSSLSLVYSVQ